MIPLELDLEVEIAEDVDLEVEAVTDTGSGLPRVQPVVDDGKIMQAKNGRWNVQHPELGEESIHFLTNLEIEALLRDD